MRRVFGFLLLLTATSFVFAQTSTIWPATATPANAAANDPNAVELGVKFRSDLNGWITGIRFYKGATNTGTHTGSLWSNTGALLASATFTNETASGWQQVNFPVPVAISANTVYVASYHTNTGNYAYNQGFFASTGVDNPPLHALANGVSGGNGVYIYGASAYPSLTYQSTNYWVDVVFSTSIVDTTPPSITATAPAANANGVDTTAPVTATFNETMMASSINTNTVQLRDTSNNLVTATVSYASGTYTAVLQPASPLAYSAGYTVTIAGAGDPSGGVKNASGLAMASTYTWSFSTASPPPPPPSQGPGGPVLVITSTSNPFTSYFAEILRAEGLNLFATSDISQVSLATLANYSVAILGQMSLTSSQVTMLTTWVNSGGTLIAMRPDKQLAGLLGLTSTPATLSDAYLLVNTASGPGAGIVGQTIQFHGAADLYTLNGATILATLYSTSSAATPYPAVVARSYGNGQIAAFTYDLAKSVVYTRQGNPAWAGQHRDGYPTLRSDDLYFGAATFDVQPDYVDLSKVAIPQADEQQRLLANMILQLNPAQMPLPRFWYFPSGKKAVVIMTGDDHGGGGTAGRFDSYIAASPAGCNVANWECVRSTSYVFPGSPLTNSQASNYVAKGFEVGLHPSVAGSANFNCADFTSFAQLDSIYTTQLSQWQGQFPSQPAPTTNRTHCITWSDWATQASVELGHGIRLDTNYYYWPPTWINDQPGMFTGSGMPMRFADQQGNIINVYQAATQMTDESGQTYPKNINTLLDNAIGAPGYYGAFTANMHTDSVSSPGSDAIVTSAQARGVPVISAQQMLTWLDGRNGSSFGSLAWNSGTLTFTVSVGAGANGIQALLPLNSPAGALRSLMLGGTAVSYTPQTIKGIQYAVFSALPGSYTAFYGTATGGTGPVISAVTAGAGSTTATISWTTDIASTSRVDYGTSSSSLNLNASNAALVTSHSIGLTGLSANTIYFYRVTSIDANNNSSTSPTSGNPPLSFTTTPTSTPSIVSRSPVAGATGVPLSTICSVQFSTAMNASTITSSTFTLTAAGSSTPVAATVTASGSSATLTPNAPLLAGTVYTAFVSGTVADINGTTMGTNSNWTFTTDQAPTITARSPAAGATNVAANTTVSVTFSAAMNTSTITSASFTLTAAGSSTPITATVAASGSAATLTPSAVLLGGTVYTARVLGTVSDSLGTPMGTDVSWSFTTATPSISSVTLNPTTVTGGTSSTATVTLSSVAPSGGISVTLSSSNTAAATVPASVTIAAGSATAAFTVTTVAVTSATTSNITASYGTSSAFATLNVNPQGALGIDVTTFRDRSTTGSTIATPAFSTKAANELLLAFVSTDARSANMTVTSVTGAGLTWSLVVRANKQLGTAEIWRAFAPNVLTNVTVTANLAQSVAASITVMSFTGASTAGTGGSGAIGATASVSAASGAPSASLVTTRNNSWVFGVGNDWDTATARTLGPNQTMVHQYLATGGDTFWVQRQNATTPLAGTPVTINDTAPTADTYNLSICEILPQ